MLVKKRREDPLPIQLMHITSQNRPALAMCYLWRSISYSESILIAPQLTVEKAPTSILFLILQKNYFLILEIAS